MSNPFAGAAAQAAPAAQTPPPAQAAPPAEQPQTQPAAGAGFAPPPSTVPAQAPATGGDPFGMPSGGGGGARIADDLGAALLVRPTEYKTGVTTQHGVTDAVVCDWIVLDGANQGQVREASMIFQTALRSDLKRILDNPATPFMVGVLTMGEAKAGKSAPYVFGLPSDDQVTLARQAAAHFGWI